MSTKAQVHSKIGLLSIFLIMWISGAVNAETKVKLTIKPNETIEVRINRQFAKNTEIDLIDSYADAVGLRSRIRSIFAKSNDNEMPGFRPTGFGNFSLLNKADVVGYVLSAKPDFNLITSPHISWVNEEFGLLNLADVLPESLDKPLELTIATPSGWTIATNEKRSKDNVFKVADPGRAVFLVGKKIRQRTLDSVNLAIVGDWQFSDDQAVEMTDDILKHYRSVFRDPVEGKKQVIIIPFPGKMSLGRWRAETRGRTVTIASSLSAYKNIGIQRLHEQLRHELFHLWLPNDLDITGDYAWFYEGFARYESLKAALKLRQIRFEDYLATLSEAQQISDRSRNDLTLAELSDKQWLVGPGVLGARATLFAFFVDLKTIESGDKLGSSRLMRRFYKEFKRKKGNALASEIGDFFRKQRAVANSYDRFVLGRLSPPVSSAITRFGIQSRSRGGRIYFELKSEPTRRERAMLKKLGYNSG